MSQLHLKAPKLIGSIDNLSKNNWSILIIENKQGPPNILRNSVSWEFVIHIFKMGFLSSLHWIHLVSNE